VGTLDAGNGRIAVHADAYRREAEDARIPGYARSAQQRAIDAATDPGLAQPWGRLPNTFASAEGGSLGGSLTWGRGYVGAALGSLRSTYGTPADDSVEIEMRKQTIDFAGEARGLDGAVEALKFRLNHSDYQHQEKEKGSGAVNTTFKNQGSEGRLEAVHRSLGPVRGGFGFQFSDLALSALGDEAFLPQTRTRTNALFGYEEFQREHWKLSAGVRLESARLGSSGDQSDPALARFGAPRSRSFSAQSLSIGGLVQLDPRWSAIANLATTQRVPTNYELFANGPHGATATYEVGNPDFDKERSTSIELALRRREGPNSLSLGAFRTNFRNYILLAPTGRMRGADGSYEDPANPGTTTSGEPADLPEYLYLQVPAVFRGLEAQGRWRLIERGPSLDLEARADYVRANRSDTDEPLPRIPPLRLGLALVAQAGAWYARADLARAAAQARTASNELPTDGYTMLNAYASYRVLSGGRVAWEVFAKANNLLNADARNHASVLKDIAPLPGRGLLLGVRAYF